MVALGRVSRHVPCSCAGYSRSDACGEGQGAELEGGGGNWRCVSGWAVPFLGFLSFLCWCWVGMCMANGVWEM